jgi:putative intracellular protease/amidase
LDVAPIDFLNGITRRFWDNGLKGFVPDEYESQVVDIEFHWVSKNGSASPSKLTSGIKLVATVCMSLPAIWHKADQVKDSFETCPPLDIVLIGAHIMGYTPDDTELAFVRKAWDDCSAFLTICGGILVPLQAGILEDKTATAPAFMVDDVRKQAPGTNWVTKRWVRDGKLWTSGALLNGTDMMTNFVKSYWGKGDDSLVGFLCKLGAWPDRDIDYKDVV